MNDMNVSYSMEGISSTRGLEVIAKMLLLDDAKDYRDVMQNKLWADLFVELQRGTSVSQGDLGHEDGLHLDTFIEGLIALCTKRATAASICDADKRFYMDCVSKFTQLLVFINTPQPLVNKPYMKRAEAVRQLKTLRTRGKY
jgi:hypothetical protein